MPLNNAAMPRNGKVITQTIAFTTSGSMPVTCNNTIKSTSKIIPSIIFQTLLFVSSVTYTGGVAEYR